MSRRDEERPPIGPIGGRGLSGAVGGGLAKIEREERRAAAGGATQGRAHLGLRLSVMATISLGLLAVLLVKLWTVQVIESKSFRSNAIHEIYQDLYTPAPRGEIVTREGGVLATDTAEEVVTIKPVVDPLTGKSWIASSATGEANASSLLGIPESQINADLNSVQDVPHQPVVIAIGPAQGVTEQAVVQISENPSRYPGVSVSRQFVRDYPQGSLASQVLGYTGVSPAAIGYTAKGKPIESPLDLAEYNTYGNAADPTFGESGLEQQYQKYLFGTPGIEKQAVDPGGNPLGVVSTTPPQQGDTVGLNMDMGLEQALASDLSNQVATLRSGASPVAAPDASGVVMDVRTGAVLAIASYPTYNDNLWVGGISNSAYQQLVHTPGNPLNDYAVADPQPPGSDWKLVSSTAALDDGLINPYYTYDDPGYYTIGNLTLHDAPGEVPGVIDISQALTESSDVFFYNVGAMFYEAWQANPKGYPYGQTPIQDVAAKYGFGTTDGVDLPPINVSTGQVDTPALEKALGTGPWTLGDNMEMAFGQGATQITPLQLADAYAAFADHGVVHAPELAAEIVSPTGKLVKRIAPKITGVVHYASSADYQAIYSGFDGVTQNPLGTAYQAFVGFPFNKWDVAGKTGTATVVQTEQPTSWFVAFGGPRGQAPEYAVAIQVNQGGYGATASAPVAREIFDYLMAHGVPPLSANG